MAIKLNKSSIKPQFAPLSISGSKSETNRVLVLQALFPQIRIVNASDSDDSQIMKAALQSNSHEIYIGHAGTTMRFLTAYFAIQPHKEVVLTGSARMKERPIHVLVEALRSLGADINYLEKEGYPPIKIKGKELTKQQVSLDANISSQYISALLLIASKLRSGLTIILKGTITSRPYIEMTLKLLNSLGISASFIGNTLKVSPAPINITPKTLTIESDWSSASYFYSMLALSKAGTTVSLSSFSPQSLQGDAVLCSLYKDFGVTSSFKNNILTLKKESYKRQKTQLDFNLINTPDLAQTIAVSCLGLGIGVSLTGLHTLKIKETDRLIALQTELQKLGAEVALTDDSLVLKKTSPIKKEVTITTYNDHRMAMAFAPLALQVHLVIENPSVVSKSYPNFWNDLESLGVSIENWTTQ